jgi:UDP-glucose 4,6-dehydratase
MIHILITGGCGFIGSNFINYLCDKYDDIFVLNIDKFDYAANEEFIKCKNDASKYKRITGDISDEKFILSCLQEHQINYIIHFAAQTHVDNSFQNSIKFTEDNVLGTHHLLEAIRAYQKLKLFIHISTDEVYGEIDLQDDSCCEKSLLNPTNPYAATKACAEFLVKAYNYSFKLPYIIIRMNNVYGCNQYPEKLIPKFITLLLHDKKMTIHGKGDTRRNFIHARDASSAIMTILEHTMKNNENQNKIYNIGSNNEYSVIDIAEMLLKDIKGHDEKIEDWIEFVEDRNFNDFRYSINSEKLKKLGWNESINFLDGIKETIEYYKVICMKKS